MRGKTRVVVASQENLGFNQQQWRFQGDTMGYPLVNVNKKLLKITIERIGKSTT
jgi:hypothetical protein